MTDFVVKSTDEGKKVLCLRGFNGEKMGKVNLFNIYLSNDLLYHSCSEDPKDPFCVFNLYHRYIKHLPPHWKGKLLLKGINPDDRLRVKPINGVKRCADLTDQGALGLNACNKICQRVAWRCGLLHPEKQLASGRRRAGITKLANSNLGSAEVIKAARHKDCVINATYQHETQEAHKQRHKVQRYKVSF